MKRVSVIGSGYVGLVAGACLAELGHRVVCADCDEKKIGVLNGGGVPIYEPGLAPLIRRHRERGTLSFTTRIDSAVRNAEIVFIAVNTPPLKDGGADLSFVERCARDVARYASGYTLLVEKSTVPVQTGDCIRKTVALHRRPGVEIEVASNPEFLREGSAVADFLKPDRVVIGVQSKRAERLLKELYAPLAAPIVVTGINSAEMIKHASNSFLAMKISYVNAIAALCEKVGADISEVARGMGLDARIGPAFLNAGAGYGGSCFPKDVSAFIRIAETHGYDFDLLRAVERINAGQRRLIVEKLRDLVWILKGKVVGVWGLSFKPDTDDLRNAPSIDLIEALLRDGASVQVYDPVAMDGIKARFPELRYCSDPYDAARNADAVVAMTEWEEIRRVRLRKVRGLMAQPLIVDARNMFEPEALERNGFRFRSIGRRADGARRASGVSRTRTAPALSFA